MPLLEARNIVVQYPAVRALDGVSLTFEAGEVHGVIGENGAGKSTLMNVLAGLRRPSEGLLVVNDRESRFNTVQDALTAGIAMIHQELNLVDSLSVAENIFLGREPVAGGVLNRGQMGQRATPLLARVGARFAPSTPLGSLPLAQRQLVEIAKALSYEARVLIMDEPTAVLSESETRTLFELIRELREQGVCVIYISHRLAEVEEVCDRITVLRDGRWVATLAKGSADQAEMARLMVGRALGDLYPPATHEPTSEVALEVRNLTLPQLVCDVSFSLSKGEILGVAGLVGSGRTELAEALVGLRPRTSGEIRLQGRPVDLRSPTRAARAGMAYVSEDRKDLGLLLSLNTIENTTLANLRAFARPLLRKREEEVATRKWVERLAIRVGDLSAPTLFLSGGNQQKVAIAKWLELGPQVLILDEPTRGVDVGGKREIYLLIRELAAAGMACLVISSELPELLGMCDRLLVMRAGRIVGELPGDRATEEQVMVLAAGVAA